MEENAIYQDYQRVMSCLQERVNNWQPSEDEQELFKDFVPEPENEDLEF